MLKKYTCFIFCLIALPVLSQPITSNFYKAVFVRVVDGDTIKVNLPCSYKMFCRNISVRVAGVDCPEIHSKDKQERQQAQAAKYFTRAFLQGHNITLKGCRKGTYFRIVCAVLADGKDLSVALLDAGLAIPYDGGEKPYATKK